jgi:high-affinity K+ transport system ATPase subunit B
MRKNIIIHVLFFSVCILLSYFTFDVVAYSDLRNSLEALQEMSAAVFALAGIWVAYIYPEAITVFTNPKEISLLNGSERADRVQELVITILVSAFVLLATIFIFLFESMFKNIVYIQSHRLNIMFFLVMIACYLTLIQSKALVTIMINNIKFVNVLYHKKKEQQANKDL